MKSTKHNEHDQSTPRSAKEMLLDMIESVEREDLKQAMKVEIKRIFANHDRLLTMLQTRSEALEQENYDYKNLAADHQRRYEKAVREMQFFRQKYERAKEMNSQYTNSTLQRHPSRQQHQQQHLPRSLSIESGSSGEGTEQSATSYQQHPLAQHKTGGNTHIQSYPLTPTSPQPSVLPSELALFANYDLTTSDFNSIRQKSTLPSRSSSTSTNTHGNIPPQWSLGSTDLFEKSNTPSLDDTVSSISRLRQNSTTSVSVHSSHSSTTESPSFASSLNNSSNNDSKDKSSRKKQSWQLLQPNISSTGMGSSPSTTSSTFSKESVGGSVTSTTSSSSAGAGTGTSIGATVQSVPMTPVRSSTATNGYTGASLIQQRRVDPLIFGGSDGLWDTISKSKGSDVTVEKIISNFLRRGGSPNTAKQSPTNNAVKYGFGMIHALVATKASGSLDLLLQQGANPNAYSLGQIEDDKVTPGYVAASVGWLAGLQKLVQAGCDLMNAHGGGVKNKTVLHVAAEHCHAAVVEYIVDATQGRLNLEVDSLGASVLHYACASGHTDLVSFLAKSCEIPVHQEDHRGELPLHWAARHGRLEVVTLLVERCGCDCNTYVPRKVGTPLDLARAGGHRRLVDYLKGLGGVSAKKMEKRREEEKGQETPVHLESTLLRNGLFGMGDDDF